MQIMHHPRLYIDHPLRLGQTVCLSPEQSHHMIRVIRARPEQHFLLFDSTGLEYQARISSVDKYQTRLEIEQKLPEQKVPTLRITLALAVCKPRIVDLALQKAVELGATDFVLIHTQHSPLRYSEKNQDKRLAHCRRLIISATEQCGRSRLCRLHEPQTFSRWLSSMEDPGTALLFHPHTDRPTAPLPRQEPRQITLIIGPEGGFSEDELRLATERGCHTVCLGQRVLRTETAAIVALSLCHMRYGDFVDCMRIEQTTRGKMQQLPTI